MASVAHRIRPTVLMLPAPCSLLQSPEGGPGTVPFPLPQLSYTNCTPVPRLSQGLGRSRSSPTVSPGLWPHGSSLSGISHPHKTKQNHNILFQSKISSNPRVAHPSGHLWQWLRKKNVMPYVL